MKKVTKIKANGFYLFQGRANANSCFIEKLLHAKQFLLYANYFLKDYLSIYDYVITKDGWALVVKVKNKEHVSVQMNRDNDEVWRIISERIRLFLSTFVRVTNKEKGRTGCLVHSGYERYFFETLHEAMDCIKKVRMQQVKLYSKKKKYRSLKTHYKIPSRIVGGSVFFCSRDVRKAGSRSRKLGEVFKFIDLRNVVVQKLVNSTITSHNPYNSHPITLMDSLKPT